MMEATLRRNERLEEKVARSAEALEALTKQVPPMRPVHPCP